MGLLQNWRLVGGSRYVVDEMKTKHLEKEKTNKENASKRVG